MSSETRIRRCPCPGIPTNSDEIEDEHRVLRIHGMFKKFKKNPKKLDRAHKKLSICKSQKQSKNARLKKTLELCVSKFRYFCSIPDSYRHIVRNKRSANM